jgi:hypothetical protein
MNEDFQFPTEVEWIVQEKPLANWLVILPRIADEA